MPASRTRISCKVKGVTSIYHSDGGFHTTQTLRGPSEIAQGRTELLERRKGIIKSMFNVTSTCIYLCSLILDSQYSERTLRNISQSLAGGSWEVEAGESWINMSPDDDDEDWETIEQRTHALNELTQEIYNAYGHPEMPMYVHECFGTRETIGVRDEHLITKQF